AANSAVLLPGMVSASAAPAMTTLDGPRQNVTSTGPSGVVTVASRSVRPPASEAKSRSSAPGGERTGSLADAGFFSSPQDHRALASRPRANASPVVYGDTATTTRSPGAQRASKAAAPSTPGKVSRTTYEPPPGGTRT